jgi:hypothetical protein
MKSTELANLAKIGKLKAEPPTDEEVAGLLKSGTERLADAQRTDLAFASRFDLAYNAAHALALLALRRCGYRSESRYLVFQSLQHTTEMRPESWRILDKAHGQRNVAEYQGHLDTDEQLLAEVIRVAHELRALMERQ